MGKKKFFGLGLPGTMPANIDGKLIVIEGPDYSGRSTQIKRLGDWLETEGHAVVNVGLKRSTLVSEELEQVLQGNVLSKRTMSLFYATDFADQLENKIIPGLHAGSIVLCDRYIYTLMARDLVRGGQKQWLESLYGFALKPDAVFYLSVKPRILAKRAIEEKGTFNYWESGMDLGLEESIYDSFLTYQELMSKIFSELTKDYDLEVVDGNRSAKAVTEALKAKITPVL